MRANKGGQINEITRNESLKSLTGYFFCPNKNLKLFFELFKRIRMIANVNMNRIKFRVKHFNNPNISFNKS